MAIRYLSGINVDSNTLFVDSTNNRVGIGTDSPTSSLTVNGTITSGVVISTSDSTEQIIIRLASDTNKQFIFGRTSTHARLFAVTQNVGYVPIAINESGGNVLIGTTTDAGYKLDVNGTGRFTSNVIINSDNTGVIVDVASRHGFMKYFLYSAGLVGANTGTDNNISTWLGRFSGSITSPTSVFQDLVVMNSGNIGIGTTNPDAIFHVAKSTSGGVGGQIVIDNPASSALGNTAELSFLTDAGASGAGTRNAKILAVNVNAGNGAAELQFHTWNGAAELKRMNIASNGVITFGAYGSGNVTGTPTYNLGVDASGNVIELPGGVVDGSGTANYVTKWQDANTVTNSIIRDDGTTVGINQAPGAAKFMVNGSVTGGGQTTYLKSYASIDTTGQAVAGIVASTNGQSCMFTFTCRGGTGGYQRVIYSCYNAGGNWYTNKVIDEGTNTLDVVASADGATITFTFKARSVTQGYTCAVLVEQFGSAIDTTYL